MIAVSPDAPAEEAPETDVPMAGVSEADFPPPADLTATMTAADGAIIVDLHWKYKTTLPGGCFVQFNIRPYEHYTTLAILPSEITTYRHANIAPNTRFGYRLLPYFGYPSETVEITTGKAFPADPNRMEPEGPVDKDFPRTDTGNFIRAIEEFPQAVPDGLTAELSLPTNVVLRWNDRALGEDGYILEVALASAQPDHYQACALLPPNTTSFRKIMLPPETKLRFRIRAFINGSPSGVAEVFTPSLSQTTAH